MLLASSMVAGTIRELCETERCSHVLGFRGFSFHECLPTCKRHEN